MRSISTSYLLCLGASAAALARPPPFSHAYRVRATAIPPIISAFVPSRTSNRLDVSPTRVRDVRAQHSSALGGVTSGGDGGGGGGSDKGAAGKKNTSRSGRERGIYSRPSGAIERGSGFFIPGLEGSRVRFFFGVVILIVDALNHFSVTGGAVADFGQVTAEALAAIFGALLLLQALVEFGVERGYANGGAGSGSDAGVRDEAEQEGKERTVEASGAPSGIAGRIRSASEAIVRLTPVTEFRLAVEGSGIVYSLGTVGEGDDSAEDERNRLVSLALDAVYGSKGGRVALTAEHPASALLPEDARRCILLQRVEGGSERACFVMGSNRLLPSFTRNDLRWVGRLGEYVADAKRTEQQIAA